jgi:translation initiation factor 2 beta subunit (eIF-2beta)/eIF-5
MSKVCDRVLRRKKKESLFVEAKQYFGFEYFTQNNNLYVLFHEPTPYCKVIKPQGSLANGLSKNETTSLSKSGEIEKLEKIEKSKNEEKSQEKSSSTSQVSEPETHFSKMEKMEKSQNRQNFENLAGDEHKKVQEPKPEKEAVNSEVQKVNEKVFSQISPISPFLNTPETHNKISQEDKTVLCDRCWRSLSLEEMKRYVFVQEVGTCSKCGSRHFGVYVKRGEKL